MLTLLNLIHVILVCDHRRLNSKNLAVFWGIYMKANSIFANKILTWNHQTGW